MEFEREIPPVSASQGETVTMKTGSTEDAAYAIDKDLSTRSNAGVQDEEVWLKIELGSTTYIHKVVIYYIFYTDWFNPSNWFAESEDNFDKTISGTNKVDVSVYQGDVKQRSCGILQLTQALNQSDQIYRIVCNVEGDTVKFSKKNNNIVVAEVVILGKGW